MPGLLYYIHNPLWDVIQFNNNILWFLAFELLTKHLEFAKISIIMGIYAPSLCTYFLRKATL